MYNSDVWEGKWCCNLLKIELHMFGYNKAGFKMAKWHFYTHKPFGNGHFLYH